MSEPQGRQPKTPQERLEALRELLRLVKGWNKGHNATLTGQVVEPVTLYVDDKTGEAISPPVRNGMLVVEDCYGGQENLPPCLKAAWRRFGDAVDAAEAEETLTRHAENQGDLFQAEIEAEMRRVEGELARAALPERITLIQEQIVGIVRQAGRRLTTREVLAELEKVNGAASEGSTKQSLAELTRRVILTSATDGYGKGYGLPEWK